MIKYDLIHVYWKHLYLGKFYYFNIIFQKKSFKTNTKIKSKIVAYEVLQAISSSRYKL